MRYEFDYEYSDALLRLAIRRSLALQFGWRFVATVAVVLVLSLALCTSDSWGYLCGAVHGGVVVLVALFVLIGQSAAEESLRFARKLPARAAHCVFTDEAMTIENALATSVLKWPVIQRVVRGPDVWLFFMARGQLMPLPADKLGGEVGAFIESRVTAAGGKMQ